MSTTVSDVLAALERICPSHDAFDFDHIGLLVGRRSDPVTKAVVTFDSSLASIEFARQMGADLMISHHPVIWNPLPTLDADDYNQRRAYNLARAGIACIAAHTNWDAAPGGLNDWLAETLGLQNIRPFGASGKTAAYLLTCYTPPEAAPDLIDALSAAGAGEWGEYQRCAYLSQGEGTFEPSLSANPTIGQPGSRETVAETKLEMLVPAARLKAVEQALRQAHPYEEPAFAFASISPRLGTPIGRIGELPSAVSVAEFQTLLDDRLQTRAWVWGTRGQVQRVAVVGGAADDEWRNAQAAGADAFVTGEVKQHVAMEAGECGLVIAAAGHYATEHPSMARLLAKLSALFPAVKWTLFEPAPGESGRPL